MLAREQNMARQLHHTHALSSFSTTLLNPLSQWWEVHYNSKTTTLPRACATRKGALTPPRSVTARSFTRINGHSKHLFQTYVSDLFVSLCCVNIGTPLKSLRGEKDKSPVMPRVDSAWLEHQRLASPSRCKPQATISPEPPQASGHQNIRGGNPYNKPDHVPR
jgi:hypothetical protein